MKHLLTVLGLFAAAACFFLLAERIRADVSVFSPGGGAGIPTSSSSVGIITTWANGSTGHVDLSTSPQKFTLTNDAAITGFDNAAAAGQENSTVLTFTNSASSNCTIRVTAAGYTDVGTGARSYVCTNGSQFILGLNKNDMGFHGQGQAAY